MRKLAGYSILWFTVGLLSAQSVKMEKKFIGSFSTQEIYTVEIDNRYGDVIVNTWKTDSVKVVAIVVAEAKSQDLVYREINRVDVNIRKTGPALSAVTKVDPGRSKGVLGDLLSQVEDLSKSVLGSNRLIINYEVWIPDAMTLTVENKYGDIYIDQLAGDVTIVLSHGDLRAGDLTGTLDLRQVFGKTNINKISKAKINLRGVEMRVSKIDKASFQSGSSEVKIGYASEIQLDSRNDKYEFTEVSTLSGNGSFTDVMADFLTREANLSMNYGVVLFEQINKNFDRINIQSKSTDIRMALDQSSYIKTRISGQEDKMILPNSMMVMTREMNPDGTVHLNGFVGNTHQEFSQMDINLTGGQLIISIQATDIFTNKK